MAHRYPKPKIGYGSDIHWYTPKYKRPIATSTKACGDSIEVMTEKGYNTPNKIVKAINDKIFIGCYEEKLIMEEYIRKGFGDLVLNVK